MIVWEGLNPFFIRARFGQCHYEELEREVEGLNPFFIRARFGPSQASTPLSFKES